MKHGILAWVASGVMAFGALAPAAGAASGNYKLTPEMLRFHYETVDAGITLDCTHVLQDADAQDWAVTCGTGQDTRKYVVHLWLTEYDRPVLPKQSFELLYWVTDMTPAQPVSNSTTIWYHFREPSDLYEIQASISLEQDTAELQLEITPPAPSEK